MSKSSLSAHHWRQKISLVSRRKDIQLRVHLIKSRRFRRLFFVTLITTIMFVCWVSYRVAYHPDIHAAAVHFAEASSKRDYERLYPFFDDSYQKKLSPAQSRLFLAHIYAYLPENMQMKAEHIEHIQYEDGSEAYDVRMSLLSNSFPAHHRVVTISFGSSKERGWTIQALFAYEALFAQAYGVKSADYVEQAFKAASSAPP